MRPGEDIRKGLEANAENADRLTDWPADSWGLLRQAGALRWGIAVENGGLGLDPTSYLIAQEALAAGCLTTAFVLSQREAAVRLIARFAEPVARRAVLSALADGGGYVTVGISQLTTSRQHRPPSLVAVPVGAEGVQGFQLTGELPWVTGADRAEMIVTAAALPDGRQVLLRLPPTRPGVTVGPPMDLVALRSSRTAAVHCEEVLLEPGLVLAGPADGLFGAGTGGGLETSALALGLTRTAVEYLLVQSERRPELVEPVARLTGELDAARRELHELAVGAPDLVAVHILRTKCSGLAARSTQAALVGAKGTGFVSPHPAGRWARQALFFLVWSCPVTTTAGLLAELTT